ncbi:MAG: hypothetical protein PHX83_16925 [Acidobacteriia bacterium]|nr:hypothetical protein [Terriglobia bacterium]
MKGLPGWLALVVIAIFLGALTGWGVGLTARWVNLDYIPDLMYYVDKGWRLGLVVGAFLALCALAGNKESAGIKDVSAGIMGAWLGILLLAILSGAAGYLLSRFHFLELPLEVRGQVGNPNRIFFNSGLTWGAVAGTVISPFIVGISVWRKRN